MFRQDILKIDYFLEVVWFKGKPPRPKKTGLRTLQQETTFAKVAVGEWDPGFMNLCLCSKPSR